MESARGARKLEYAKRDAYEGAGGRRGGDFGEEVRDLGIRSAECEEGNV